MTAAARSKPAARPSALEIFIARAEARAILWAAGDLSLHDAVDELQAAAIRSGLVAQLGQDEVQRLMTEAFAAVRDDLAVNITTVINPESALIDDEADDDSDLDDTFAAACRAADAAQRDRKVIERPKREAKRATLQAAQFLVQTKDPARLRAWLDTHTAAERAEILRHVEQREKARAK